MYHIIREKSAKSGKYRIEQREADIIGLQASSRSVLDLEVSESVSRKKNELSLIGINRLRYAIF